MDVIHLLEQPDADAAARMASLVRAMAAMTAVTTMATGRWGDRDEA